MTQGSSVMTSFLTLIWRIWCRCICHQKCSRHCLPHHPCHHHQHLKSSSSSVEAILNLWLTELLRTPSLDIGTPQVIIVISFLRNHYHQYHSHYYRHSYSLSWLLTWPIRVNWILMSHIRNHYHHYHCHSSSLYWFLLLSNLICKSRYDPFSDVGESRVWWRADFLEC